MEFKIYDPQRSSSGRSGYISAEQWEIHHEMILKLYIFQNRTQTQVLEALHACGFRPSPRQLTAQLSEWEMFKNVTKRNNRTMPSVDASFSPATDHVNLQDRINNDLDSTPPAQRSPDESHGHDIVTFDSFQSEIENLYDQEYPFASTSLHTVPTCEEGDVEAAPEIQDISVYMQSQASILPQYQEQEMTHQAEPANSVHLGPQGRSITYSQQWQESTTDPIDASLQIVPDPSISAFPRADSNLDWLPLFMDSNVDNSWNQWGFSNNPDHAGR